MNYSPIELDTIKEINMNKSLSIYQCSKLDESTARRQLKSPRSLSGRSIHLTLVTKWSWSWSWMTYCHPLCAMSISPPILRYSLWSRSCVVKGQGHVWPSKIKGQGYGQDQTHWSHLRPGVRYVCFSFCCKRTTFGWDIGNSIFDLENSRSRSNPTVTFEL